MCGGLFPAVKSGVCVCVCVCVRACVRVCVHACVRVCVQPNGYTVTMLIKLLLTITTVTIYFIHPSGKLKLSSDHTMKNISQ